MKKLEIIISDKIDWRPAFECPSQFGPVKFGDFCVKGNEDVACGLYSLDELRAAVVSGELEATMKEASK